MNNFDQGRLTWTTVEHVGLQNVTFAQSNTLSNFGTHAYLKVFDRQNGVQIGVFGKGVSCVMHDGVIIVGKTERIDLLFAQFIEIVLLTLRRYRKTSTTRNEQKTKDNNQQGRWTKKIKLMMSDFVMTSRNKKSDRQRKKEKSVLWETVCGTYRSWYFWLWCRRDYLDRVECVRARNLPHGQARGLRCQIYHNFFRSISLAVRCLFCPQKSNTLRNEFILD